MVFDYFRKVFTMDFDEKPWFLMVFDDFRKGAPFGFSQAFAPGVHDSPPGVHDSPPGS